MFLSGKNPRQSSDFESKKSIVESLITHSAGSVPITAVGVVSILVDREDEAEAFSSCSYSVRVDSMDDTGLNSLVWGANSSWTKLGGAGAVEILEDDVLVPITSTFIIYNYLIRPT